MSFYLRKSGGEVYGPVDADTLSRWAADGRIVPEDQLSTDQAAWTPASDRPELGMDWLVDFGDQRYGPLHALALCDLLRDGSVSADQIIVHRKTGDQRRLGDALAEALVAENARLRAQLESAPATVRGAGSAEPHQELAVLQTRLDTALADGARLQVELDQVKQRADEQRAAFESREQELTAQLAEATQHRLGAQARRDALERQVAELQAHAQPPAPGSPEAAFMTTAYHDLAQNYDRLTEQLSARTAELKNAQEARTEVQKEADDRVRLTEDKMRRLQAEADDIRRKLAELADSHAQLVRAYRDLNDRFIRSRQQSAPAPAPEPPPAAPLRAPATGRQRRA